MKLWRFFVAVTAVIAITLLSAGVVGLTHTAQAQTNTPIDYDTDDDGLIEVGSLVQLDAIRYDLDGDGSPTDSTAYDAAFPNAAAGMGCPSSGCTGYELTTNLDFDTNGNGEADAGDDYWNDGAGWDPITDSARSGYQTATFHTTFEGNSHVISGLYIDRSGEGNVGFFGRVWGGEIRNLGLEGVVVKGERDTGGLVGSTSSGLSNPSLISASYVTGSVSGGSLVGGLVGFNRASIDASYAEVSVTGTSNVGGLVGNNHSSGSISSSYATGSVTGGSQAGGLVGNNQAGSITASYATGSVSGNLYVGGLVGDSDRGTTITASYATGSVSGRVAGGLVGVNLGTIADSYSIGAVSGSSSVGGLVGANSALSYTGTVTASYWDTQTSGQSSSDGGEGKTTSELQSPTSNTGIYATWDDDVWDFGTSSDYPSLIGIGPASASLGAPTIGAVTPGTGSLAISWTAPSSDGGSAITAYDLRHIETSADETVDSNWTVVDDVWTTGGGTLQYTITGLTGGTQYDLQIRAVNAGGDGPWSATATGTPTAAAATSAGDYDADDDGLIEVGSLAQLDAIRYDLDGDGSPTNSTAYDAAFPNAATGMGCPSEGCTGYELTTNLDFDTNGNGEADAGDAYWNDGAGWEPIGSFFSSIGSFTATFEGNGNAISGLFINRPTTSFVGLFGAIRRYLGGTGTIRNIGLTGVDVTGSHDVGGLVGWSRGTISGSYATGAVSGASDRVGGLAGYNVGAGTVSASYAAVTVSGSGRGVGGLAGRNDGSITASYAIGDVSSAGEGVGGLVGANYSAIRASYATGTASGRTWVGGLVGLNSGTIAATYATGAVSGSSMVGGLVGTDFGNTGTATASYWDTETSGQSSSDGGEGKTTSELQSPTSNTGIYATWDDDVWDFGTSSDYPSLIGVGPASESLGAPTIGEVTPGTGSLAISWTAPSSDGGSQITAYDLRHIETSADETDDSNWTVVDDVWATGGGTLQYTLTGLTGGTQYDLQIRAVNAGGDGPWSATATGTPTAAAATSAGDYDADDDGLIEVGSLAQLDAIRYDLDGDGSPTNSTAYDAAFPNAATGMGCPSTGCTGYELTASLDFDTNGNGEADAGDTYWNDGAGWEPIGTFSTLSATTFSAIFEGNNHAIHNLYIDRGEASFIGLFGLISGEVMQVGLISGNVTGDSEVGALVGRLGAAGSAGNIMTGSYATGKVNGNNRVGGLVGNIQHGSLSSSYANVDVSGGNNAGGLVGLGGGPITRSYASGSVSGDDNVGGLIGRTHFYQITASYATGDVTGNDRVGGLAGHNRFSTIVASYAKGSVSGDNDIGGLIGSDTSGTITASYWDTETSGQSTSDGGEGKTTSELQSPTSNTGIYDTWDDDVWDFGTASQYPALKGLGLSVAEQRQSHPAGASASTGLTDREILVALYNATDGANWTDNTNWLSDEPLGEWFGVSTDTEGRVTRLTLSRNNLAGTMPVELGNLTNLVSLKFTSNDLTGTIPTELGNLSNLQLLEITFNDLTGTIPTELGNLSNLRTLSLYGNQLTGPIPTELGDLSYLHRLSLGGNDLTGSIPPELGNLSNLTILELEDGKLTGTIPTELGRLSNLMALELQNNDLTGAIPTELDSLSNLTWLHLGGNQLTGTIPTELGNLSKLTTLQLQNNDLAGDIPAELGDLSNLIWLSLGGNQLTGAIPTELGSLTSLRNLALSSNQLTGTIPVKLGSLSNLEWLHLQDNQLTGAIPSELSSLSNLTTLYLWENRLTGAIPAELGNLSNLESLALKGNQLTGAIPSELGNLTNLVWLDLHGNQLTGAIPSELGSLSNLSGLFLHDNQLTGVLPQSYTDLKVLSHFTFGDNDGLCAPTDDAFQAWLQAIPNTSFTNFLGSSLPPNPLGPNCSAASASTGLTDREILVALYNATDGANWEDNTNWLSNEPLGGWHGITTDADGRVTALGLARNNLTGTIPAELGGLSNLTSLSLGRNDLTGAIPSQLGNLSNLETLWLGDNQLTGAIPAELGSLSNLEYLGIEGNGLTGAIPSELGNLSSLTWLALNGNQLTGALPQSFTNLTALDDFAFSDNAGLCAPTDAAFQTWLQGISNSNITIEVAVPFGSNCAAASLGASTIGEVTPGAGSLAISWTAPSSDGGSAVTAYDLRHIETSADETVDSNWTVVDDVWTTGGGTLQYTLTGLTGGTQYDLQMRAVNAGGDGPWSATATGTPTTPGNREILVALYKATDGDNWTNNTNWLSDEPLGDWHGVTTDDEGRVTRLALSINNLAGTIPADLGSLSELTVLDLDFNELTGSIPTELGSLSELTMLELYGNDLSGAIPTELGSLSNLTRLSLGANELTGGIPTELGSLSNLTMLELEDGNLTGGIPAELGSLSNLTSLELDRNDLTGTIPGELGSLTNLTWLSLHGNELIGEIPPALGNLANLANLFLSGNRLTGCIPAGLQDLDNSDFDQLDLSPCSPPGASTIGAVATGTGTLFMSWTRPWNDGRSRITAYDLRYIETEADETDESNWTVVDDVWTTGGGTLQYTLAGLTGAAQYDLQIRAVNAGGDGPWSETGTGTPRTSSACITEGAVVDATNTGLASDCEALLAWRDTLAGTATLNWSADTPITDWDGIGDDSLEGSPKRVTRLYLNRLRLDGMIPSGLSSLSALKTLYLHDNELTGTIPSSLGDLSNLTDLYASNNDLTGEIPAELGELASLQQLSLDGNDLSGGIPAELGKLTSLTNLLLHDNDLAGEIPAGIGKLSSLESLDIAENNLSGSIPAELGKLMNLVGLGLSDNDLEGEIPPEIGGLAKLQELYLHRNMLSGQIPDELGQLSELTDLWLNSNYLSGQIPRSPVGFTKLTSLRLADNGFTGCLPMGLAAMGDSDADQLDLETCGSVTGVAVSSRPAKGDTYALGEMIRIRVTFSEAVEVTGSPRLKIDMDPADWGEKWAQYESGSGTSDLIFVHQVVRPNLSTQGIAVLANTLELNDGAIKSTATQEDADLSHPGLPHDPAHKVDWR